MAITKSDFRQAMALCVRIETKETDALIRDSSSIFAELLYDMVHNGLTIYDFMDLQAEVRKEKMKGRERL